MLIAHLPSGYLLGAVIAERCERAPVSATAILWVCLVGAVAPDFDLFYYFLIDSQSTHHHRYFTHWPIVWFSALATSVLWWRLKRETIAFLSLLFCLAALLHLALDSFVGDIWWFAPFVDKPYALFTVPARFQPWWWSFILHWSFLAELAITAWALWVYRLRSKSHRP